MQLEIQMGAMTPLLSNQLRLQMAVIEDRDLVAHLQRDADAITRLLVRGLITAKSADTARKRLVRKICKEASPLF